MSIKSKKLRAMYITQAIGLSAIALSVYSRKKAKTVDDNVACDTVCRFGAGLFVNATIIVAGVNTVRLVRKVIK